MFKNVASQKIIVFAFDATTNVPKTGDAANISAYLSKDFGAITQLTDTSATEMDATNAAGYYLFDISQTETNADTILISGKSSTANIKIIGSPATVFTLPANFTTQSIDSNGRVDVIKLAGTTCTARDIGASVLLSSGTGTGQLDFTSGVVKANVTQFNGSNATSASGRPEVNVTHWIGTAAATPTVAGVPEVDITYINGTAWNNTLAQFGVNVVAWNGTTVATPATAGIPDVNVKNIDNDAASASGTVTFPNATLASTTNITGGTITTVTNLTNAPTAGDFTATMKTSIGTAVAASAVASVTGNVGGNVTGSVGSVTGNVGGNVTGSVGSVVGLTASNLDATISSRLASASYTAPDNTSITEIKAKTDSLTFTVAGQVDSNIQYVNDTQVTGNGTAGTPWGP